MKFKDFLGEFARLTAMYTADQIQKTEFELFTKLLLSKRPWYVKLIWPS